jgi:hypothetical protein
MTPDDLRAIRSALPSAVASHDQLAAHCRRWVEGAPIGQVAGLLIALSGDPKRLAKLGPDSLRVVAAMARVGLHLSIAAAAGEPGDAD